MRLGVPWHRLHSWTGETVKLPENMESCGIVLVSTVDKGDKRVPYKCQNSTFSSFETDGGTKKGDYGCNYVYGWLGAWEALTSAYSRSDVRPPVFVSGLMCTNQFS